MTPKEPQHEQLLPPALEDDLKRLFHGPVPPEADRAVMDRAEPMLARKRWVSRWQLAAPLAAAAAIALIVWTGWSPNSPQPRLAGDIDGNGRVDILDAHVLAIGVKTGATDGAWDLNHDGVVDGLDAEFVAQAVVKLPDTES